MKSSVDCAVGYGRSRRALGKGRRRSGEVEELAAAAAFPVSWAKHLRAFPGRQCCPFACELSPVPLQTDVRLTLFPLKHFQNGRCLAGSQEDRPRPTPSPAWDQCLRLLWEAMLAEEDKAVGSRGAAGGCGRATTPGCGFGRKGFAWPLEEGRE